jgi:putative endonuclease
MAAAVEADAPGAARRWYVYMLECADGSLYTGIAIDVEARFALHAAGKGARYTRAHPPLRILFQEEHADRSGASKAEFRIKQMSAAQKRAYARDMSADQGVAGARDQLRNID